MTTSSTAPAFGLEYSDVDAGEDPQLLSDRLDRIASVDAIAAAKQYSLDLLELTHGDHVLDVGCGNGPELCALAELVGPRGRVVGLDPSRTLLARAEARGLQNVTHVELVLGDATALPFPDNAFDACRADRTLQHVADLETAVAEIARVTRPGGRIVASEYPLTFVTPIGDESLTDALRTVTRAERDRFNGVALLLPIVFRLGGLPDASLIQHELVLRDFSEIERVTNIRTSIATALQAGALSPEDGDALCLSLRERVEAGDAFLTVPATHVVATKPFTK